MTLPRHPDVVSGEGSLVREQYQFAPNGRVLSRLETLLQVIDAVGRGVDPLCPTESSSPTAFTPAPQHPSTDSLSGRVEVDTKNYKHPLRITIGDLVDGGDVNDRTSDSGAVSSNSCSRCNSPTPPLVPSPTEDRFELPDISTFGYSTIDYYPGAPACRPSVVASAITVSGYHGRVAQKSYGSEKRYLSPPPHVRIATAENRPLLLDLSVHVVAESGERVMTHSLTATFDAATPSLVLRKLYVPSRTTTKTFTLCIEIKDRATDCLQSVQSRPIAMISKPSRKTVNARCTSNSLRENAQVALFSRINAQTVRTRYISCIQRQFRTHYNFWSPLILRVLVNSHRDAGTGAAPHTAAVVGYNSVVALEDAESGARSPPLILRKVEKNSVLAAAVDGPVSQMHKIALQCATSGLFWSARSGFAPSTALSDADDLLMDGGAVDDMRLEFLPAGPNGSLTDHMCWTVAGTDVFTSSRHLDNEMR